VTKIRFLFFDKNRIFIFLQNTLQKNVVFQAFYSFFTDFVAKMPQKCKIFCITLAKMTL
jgi:hypothetical protein